MVPSKLLNDTSIQATETLHCPVCKSRVDGYLPLPAFFLEEQKRHGYIHDVTQGETLNLDAYLCPQCEASDRDRLCALFLQSYFQKAQFQVAPERSCFFVDFSPAKALSAFLRTFSFLNYRTADLYRRDVDDQVDLMNIQAYGSHSVDMFICSHVLEHLPDDQKGVSELYRILKPGGIGLFLAPILLNLQETYEDSAITSEADRWKHFGQGDHYRIYSKTGFIETIQSGGFQLECYGPEHFGLPLLQASGIAEKSALYVATKPVQ